MFKFIYGGVVLVAVLAALVFGGKILVGADGSSDWISSALSIQQQATTQAVPASLNGNIDCQYQAQFSCSVPTTYGAADQNNEVRLNGTPDFNPIYSYLENRQRFIPVPNSSTAITYTTEPAYGFYLYFNYNLTAAITKTGGFPSLDPTEYHINRPPDGKLADGSGKRLPADYGSMSFSQNGQWLVVSSPNLAMLRVNLQTFEVLPFAPGVDYSIGKDPALKTAISNDGRYAVISSQSFSVFKIYDLSTCAPVPNSITGPVACQSRDLLGFAQQQIPNFSLIGNARFMDNDNLAIYATSTTNNKNTTARYIISNGSAVSSLQYLALGDSYISGEGAQDYQSGTDTADNTCHLSLVSYPYLLGKDLDYDSYHSVACSGAVTQDITDISIPSLGSKKSQAFGKADSSFDKEIYSSFLPGYRAQINFVSQYQPKVVTLSIGGNDTGFTDIIMQCTPFWQTGTCYNSYEDRLELVNLINDSVLPKLVQTYSQIMAAGRPDMRLYVVGYPQIVKPNGDCGLNVQLNAPETVFASQLISYLDSVVQVAAARAGAFYVDNQDALDGHRLCEAEPGATAVNGVSAGNDKPGRLGGPIGNESYHPNAMGYELLENSILSHTNDLTAAMPVASPTAALPAQSNLDLLNVPASGRPTKKIELDPVIADDFAYRQTPINVSIDGAAHGLAAGTTLSAEVHSTPIQLGSFTTDSAGNLSTQILLPADLPAGYHSLHFYGTDISGQSVDIYKDIYVANTADDLDGDGVADAAEACVGGPAAEVDYDQDGIDDACDGNITQPPAAPAAQKAAVLEAVTGGLGIAGGSSSTQSNKTDGQPAVIDLNASAAQAASPAVLGAKTGSAPLPVLAHNDNLSLPGWFYAAGSGIFGLASLAYWAWNRRL